MAELGTTVPARRRRARRGEGERLREEILEAAERLLIQTGNEDEVSIRAVADAVGVTPPSIYLHFQDKNELLFEVCERRFELFDRVLEEAAAGSVDPFESLRLRGRAYVRFGIENPEQYRILFMRKRAELPEGVDFDRIRGAAAFGHLVEAVERCMASGAIPRQDPFLAATTLWIQIHGITSLLISMPNFPWPDTDMLIDRMCAAATVGPDAGPKRSGNP